MRNCGTLVLAALLMCACSADTGTVDLSELRATTQAALDTHAAAAVRRDVSRALDLFATDAVLLFPHTPPLRGIDSIGALMRRSWPVVNPTTVRYATDDVQARDDLAITIARYWVTLSPAGQTQTQDSGRYMLVWRRQPSGEWRVHRAISNTTVPAGP